MNRFSRQHQRVHIDLYPDPAVLIRSQSAAARSHIGVYDPDTAAGSVYRRRVSRSSSTYDSRPPPVSVYQSHRAPDRTSHIERYLNQGSAGTGRSSSRRHVAQTTTPHHSHLFPDSADLVHRSRGGVVHIDLQQSPVEVASRAAPSYSRHVESYASDQVSSRPTSVRGTRGYSSGYSRGYVPRIDLYPDPAVLVANKQVAAPAIHIPHLDLYPVKGLSYGPKGKTYDKEPVSAYDKFQPDDVYLEKMENILSAYPCMGVPTEPSPILPNVYLGTSANAENLRLLRKHHISFVLNCAGGHPMEFRRMRDMYAPDDTGVMGYEEIAVEDKEHADIKGQFARAHKFIDYARSHRGRVLIHCPGVSRSGAVAISYLIATGQTLLQAVKTVKEQRRVALCNYGFMKQLVQYAREKGMLEWDVKPKAQTKAGLSNPFYKYRVNAASIQRIINRAY